MIILGFSEAVYSTTFYMIEIYHVQRVRHSHFHVFIDIDMCIYYILHVSIVTETILLKCMFDTIQ